MTNNRLYANTSARIDTLFGRNEYWELLTKMKAEFTTINGSMHHQVELDMFQQYIHDNYGIKLGFSVGGMITGDYEVVDEQKYMIAILKFK